MAGAGAASPEQLWIGKTPAETKSGETSVTSPRRKVLRTMARSGEKRIGGYSRWAGEELHLNLGWVYIQTGGGTRHHGCAPSRLGKNERVVTGKEGRATCSSAEHLCERRSGADPMSRENPGGHDQNRPESTVSFDVRVKCIFFEPETLSPWRTPQLEPVKHGRIV